MGLKRMLAHLWTCCYCSHRTCCYCDHCGNCHEPAGCASYVWCDDGGAFTGVSAPGTGETTSKETGKGAVIGFDHGTMDIKVPWATTHNCGVSTVASMGWDVTKWSQLVPSNELPTALGIQKIWPTLCALVIALRTLFTAQPSDPRPDEDIKTEDIPHLDSSKGQRSLFMAECDLCRKNFWSDFAETGTSSSTCQVPGSRYGSRRTQSARLGLNRHRQCASNPNQFSKAALHRDLRHLQPSAMSFCGSCWGRKSERHQYKMIFIPLIFVTYPNFASAAASTNCDAIHQPLPYIHTLLGSQMEDPFSPTSSTAQYFIVWGVFICVAGGMLILQRTNPHLKYFGFLANGFLMTVCLTEGTETMLNLFPWTVMGTLLISSLFYLISCSIRGSADHTRLRMSDSCEKGLGVQI